MTTSRSTPPTDLVIRAIELATRLHAGQTRKGSNAPYITHPLEVMEIVRAHGGTEIEQAAAVCHDTAEDQGGQDTLALLARELGDPVAAIVEGCSDSILPRGAEKPPWRERKEAYIAHVRTAASRSTMLVSCADKLANARSILADLRDPAIGSALWSRFKAGKEEQLWYYDSLAQIFLERLPGALAEELAAAVADIRRPTG
jgi:GTP pyrophosphokinase